jgi:hypothetical protein
MPLARDFDGLPRRVILRLIGAAVQQSFYSGTRYNATVGLIDEHELWNGCEWLGSHLRLGRALLSGHGVPQHS